MSSLQSSYCLHTEFTCYSLTCARSFWETFSVGLFPGRDQSEKPMAKTVVLSRYCIVCIFECAPRKKSGKNTRFHDTKAAEGEGKPKMSDICGWSVFHDQSVSTVSQLLEGLDLEIWFITLKIIKLSLTDELMNQ